MKNKLFASVPNILFGALITIAPQNKISTFLFNTNDILNIFCIFAPV